MEFRVESQIIVGTWSNQAKSFFWKSLPLGFQSHHAIIFLVPKIAERRAGIIPNFPCFHFVSSSFAGKYSSTI